MEKMYVNEKSYEVIKLLGHGKGGYSYLVTDGTTVYKLADGTYMDRIEKGRIKWQFLKFKIFQRKNLRELKR